MSSELEKPEKALVPKDPSRLLTNAGWYRREAGLYDASEILLRKAICLREENSGEKHPDTLSSASHLVLVLLYHRKYPEAEAMSLRVLEIYVKIFGEEHSDTLSSMFNLAMEFFN